MDEYRQELAPELRNCKIEKWTFGQDGNEKAPSCEAKRFKDFVLLQKLSSELRTQLAEDIRGRRTPL
jgi:hypothetical protein